MLRQRSVTRTADHVTEFGQASVGGGSPPREGSERPPCRAAWAGAWRASPAYLAWPRPGPQCARSVWLALRALASARQLFRSCMKNKWENYTQPALRTAPAQRPQLQFHVTRGLVLTSRCHQQTRGRGVSTAGPAPCPARSFQQRPFPSRESGPDSPRCCRERESQRRTPGSGAAGSKVLTDKAGPGLAAPTVTRHLQK